jgi:hypothetical protein
MLKFDFAVLTRNGQKIDSILIAAKDQGDAERKLVQMYRSCTVLRCQARNSEEKLWQATSVEEIISLIVKAG